MKKSILLIVSILLLVNCKKTDNYFCGHVLQTDISNNPIDSLVGREVVLNDVCAGFMSVYDSLLLFSSSSFPEFSLYIYNLKNNELIGKYLRKGQGPEEYADPTHTEQFVCDKNGLSVWIRDGYSDKIQLLNLSNSLRNQNLLIDTVLTLDWRNHTFVPFGYVFVLNNSGFLVRIQAERNANGYIPDKYEIYNTQQKLAKEIEVYKNPIFKDKHDFPVENYFISRDRLKPDGSKLVMVMEMMGQMNIYDIRNNSLKGFRIINTPDFDYLTKSVENYKIFFTDVCVDDKFIYALYSNVILEEEGRNYPFNTNTVLVYNWDGEFVRKIVIDKLTREISIDPVNHNMFVLTNEDLIYKYDVSYLYKK